MKLNKLEVLEKDEIELIHGESLKLLEKVGINFSKIVNGLED